MNIGLIDVDRLNNRKGKKAYPNLAMMKISAYHKVQGDNVEWYDGFTHYDIVYISKVFNFTPDYPYPINADQVIKGGTGYDIHSKLSPDMEFVAPDYSIYPSIDNKTAYGFLTRGCPNKCRWCVVPKKEGKVKPYMDVDDIAIDGRTNLVLMDNNILASDYGLQQIQKIIDRRYRVDFNQALDARLVTPEIGELLAKVRWLTFIRFGCDTPKQIKDCERAMALIDAHRKVPGSYLMYTMISDDMQEAYHRLSYFRDNKRLRIAAQPFRDINNPHQVIPQWQQDMARWAMRREFYVASDFKDFSPRIGFKCGEYFY